MEEKVVTGGRIRLDADAELTLKKNMIVSPEQGSAYWFLVDHEEQIKKRIKDELKQSFYVKIWMNWKLPKVKHFIPRFRNSHKTLLLWK